MANVKEITIQELQELGAKTTYERLKNDRNSYVDRAIDCAKLTIPSLFPDDSDDGNTDYDTPYQSIGARGLNNLASKLGLALLPPNTAFFRLGVSDEVLAQSGGDSIKAEVEQALMLLENRIQKYIENNQIRVTIFEGLKQLIVAGNVLLYLPPAEGGCKLYTLHNYVVQRDGIGNVNQMVTRDVVSYGTLPDELKSFVDGDKKDTDTIEVYTHIYKTSDTYISYQEIEGNPIKGTEQQYPLDSSPYIPCRLFKLDGEHYGRSYVEEYLGDLTSLEKLQKAIVTMASISANIIYLVQPSGITRPKDLEKAKAGDFVVGDPNDIHALQLEKYADLQVAQSVASGIEQRLSYAFLLSSVVQRNAERVTAEEVRTVASELEDTLGGVYSLLSQELQLPLVKRIMVQMMSIGELPNLPKGMVEPTITTGIDALGRGHDLNKFMSFLQTVQAIPEAVQMIKWDNFLLQFLTSLGVDTTDLVKTPEEISQEQQQALGQEMAMQAMKQQQQQTM